MNDELSAKEFFDKFETCPLCIDFTYEDAAGNKHIVFDPCEFHNPLLSN